MTDEAKKLCERGHWVTMACPICGVGKAERCRDTIGHTHPSEHPERRVWSTFIERLTTEPSEDRVERVAAIIREHHRTRVCFPKATNEPRKTFHQGDKEAAREIIATLSKGGWNEAIEAAARVAWAAEPLEAFPIEKADLAAFKYGKDCAFAAIRALSTPAPEGE